VARSAAEAALAGAAELERQAPHALGSGPLVSVVAIFGSPISISVSGGHNVRATRESSGCVHCQLARRAITPARCSMRSRREDATSWPAAPTPAQVAIAGRGSGAWHHALDGVSRDQGPLAGVKPSHSAGEAHSLDRLDPVLLGRFADDDNRRFV
jgi:hypothetical protein